MDGGAEAQREFQLLAAVGEVVSAVSAENGKAGAIAGLEGGDVLHDEGEGSGVEGGAGGDVEVNAFGEAHAREVELGHADVRQLDVFEVVLDN